MAGLEVDASRPAACSREKLVASPLGKDVSRDSLDTGQPATRSSLPQPRTTSRVVPEDDAAYLLAAKLPC